MQGVLRQGETTISLPSGTKGVVAIEAVEDEGIEVMEGCTSEVAYIKSFRLGSYAQAVLCLDGVASLLVRLKLKGSPEPPVTRGRPR